MSVVSAVVSQGGSDVEGQYLTYDNTATTLLSSGSILLDPNHPRVAGSSAAGSHGNFAKKEIDPQAVPQPWYDLLRRPLTLLIFETAAMLLVGTSAGCGWFLRNSAINDWQDTIAWVVSITASIGFLILVCMILLRGLRLRHHARIIQQGGVVPTPAGSLVSLVRRRRNGNGSAIGGPPRGHGGTSIAGGAGAGTDVARILEALEHPTLIITTRDNKAWLVEAANKATLLCFGGAEVGVPVDPFAEEEAEEQPELQPIAAGLHFHTVMPVAVVDLVQQCAADEDAEVASRIADVVLVVDGEEKTFTIKVTRYEDATMMVSFRDQTEKKARDMEVSRLRYAKELSDKRLNHLINGVMPRYVSDTVVAKGHFNPEVYSTAVVLFFDMVKFTVLSEKLHPSRLMDLLGSLFTRFDSIVNAHDLYRVDIVGDAYIVAGGLKCQRDQNRTLPETMKAMVDAATLMLQAVAKQPVPSDEITSVQGRIGINCGTIIAGLMTGALKRYTIFGDTVNVASRMESNSLPQKIHLSSEAAAMFRQLPAEAQKGYDFTAREPMEIKGKGLMQTYFIEDKNPKRLKTEVSY